MVSFTSKEAYKSVKKLGDKQRSVYSAIKEMGMASNEQIADYLNWPINRVTGRSNELHKLGMIAFEKTGLSRSGRRAKMWSVCDLNDSKLRAISNDCEA